MLPGRLFVPLQCSSLKARRRSGAVLGEELPQYVDTFRSVGKSLHQSLCVRCSTFKAKMCYICKSKHIIPESTFLKGDLESPSYERNTYFIYWCYPKQFLTLIYYFVSPCHLTVVGFTSDSTVDCN